MFAIANNQMWQYEPLTVPSNANVEERRAWTRLIDILDDIYIRFGRMTPEELGQNSVNETNIVNQSITNAKIQDASIDSAKIKAGTINHAHIGLAEIKTAHIEDGAINMAKIGNLAVDNAKIAVGAIDNAKLGVACVESANIKDASITSAKIANLAVQTANIALGAITKALIDNEAVGTAQIANGSITDAKIVELTANKITAGTLEVARLIITGVGSIVEAINQQNGTPQLSVSTVDGGALTDRTITADKIVAKAITAGELASKTITANEIMANSITGAEIVSDSIEARHIKANEISADKLNSNVGESLDISSNLSIISKVGYVELQNYASDEELNTAINSVVEQAEDSITTKIGEVTTSVIEVDGRLEEFKSLVETWQRFTSAGLEMGKTDSPFGMLLSNERLSFTQNGQEIAYFANNKMYITSAEFGKSFSIGNDFVGYYDFIANDDGMFLNYR